MSRYIAFLRAINVGHGRTLKMESLRHVFEVLGFSGVITFISSGNVIFETATKNKKRLERTIEKKLKSALGYEVATFVRTDKELVTIASYKPFPRSKAESATELNILFLADPLDTKLKQKVQALKTETDEFHVHRREVYWLRRKKQGGSVFSTVPLDKVLDQQLTSRSAKTIRRLAVKLSSLDEHSS